MQSVQRHADVLLLLCGCAWVLFWLGAGAVLELAAVDLAAWLRVGEAAPLLLLWFFLGGVASRKSWPGREAAPGDTLSRRRPRWTSSKWRRTLALVAKVLRHTGQNFPVGLLRVLGRPPTGGERERETQKCESVCLCALRSTMLRKFSR